MEDGLMRGESSGNAVPEVEKGVNAVEGFESMADGLVQS